MWGGQEDMGAKHRGQKRKESRGFPTMLWVLAWKTHGLRGSVTSHAKSAASLQPPHWRGQANRTSKGPVADSISKILLEVVDTDCLLGVQLTQETFLSTRREKRNFKGLVPCQEAMSNLPC